MGNFKICITESLWPQETSLNSWYFFQSNWFNKKNVLNNPEHGRLDKNMEFTYWQFIKKTIVMFETGIN